MLTALAPRSMAASLAEEFAVARAQYHEARLAQARKDTPANREAVAAASARVDDVLDLYLIVRRPSRV